MSGLQRLERINAEVRQIIQLMSAGRDEQTRNSQLLTHLIANHVLVVNFILDVMSRDSSPEAQKQSTAGLQQMAGRIQDAVQRLIQQSLGRPLTECHTILVRDVVVGVIEQMKAYADWKQCRVLLTEPAQELRVHADYRAAQDCFAVLLENALKFSPRGSDIQVSWREDGSEVVVTVIDAGPGVSAEELPQLFEMGFVGAAPATAGEPKFGAGLPVAQAYAQSMGGAVVCLPRPQGVEFQIRLVNATQV